MNIFSFNRLDAVYAAMYELRYYTPEAHDRGPNHVRRGDLALIGEQTAGTSLESLENRVQYQPLRETYLRLVKATLRFDRENYANIGAIPCLTQTNKDAATLDEWLAGLQVEPGSVGVRVDHNWSHSLGGASLVLSDMNAFHELMAEVFPHYELNIDVEPSGGGYRYGEFRYRLREDALPESARRYIDHIPHRLWSGRLSFGPAYGAQRYGQPREQSWRLARNGRIVQMSSIPATDDAWTIFISLGDFGMNPNLDDLLETGRQSYINSVRARMRGLATASTPAEDEAQAQKRAESLRRFEAFRAKTQSMNTNEMVIPTLPFVEAGKGIKASRRWGIEIETGAGRDLRGVPDQWDSKGDGSLLSAYDAPRYIDPDDCDYADSHREEIDVQEVDNPSNRFTVENPDYSDPDYCDSCGDYEGDYDSDDCVELVSPILKSMHSRGLRQICEDLEFAPRTDSAGVHVHVEAKDLTVRQIKELVMGYDHIERFIEPSYDRVERGYCKRRSARELLEVVRQPEDVAPNQMRTGDRYVTVNLQALYSHGTIEFRAMGPRYNYDHLIRWAMFCREMVNVVANGATSKLFARAKSWEDVTAIFAKYGTEYNYATVGHMDAAFADQQEDIKATV